MRFCGKEGLILTCLRSSFKIHSPVVEHLLVYDFSTGSRNARQRAVLRFTLTLIPLRERKEIIWKNLEPQAMQCVRAGQAYARFATLEMGCPAVENDLCRLLPTPRECGGLS